MTQEWIFTFGADHVHPVTGESLYRCYVAIEGSCDDTRDWMLEAFGREWSHQYSSGAAAGVERYGLRQVSMP